MSDLWDVVKISMICMMGVLFFGSGYDRLQPVKKQYVECSVTLQNMASKYNVTLLDECEITGWH